MILRRTAAVLALACALVGCARQQLASVQSPDGKTQVVVGKSTLWINSVAKIYLERSNSTETLKQNSYDMFPTSAVVGWSPDSKQFGVIVFDKIGQHLELGYNVEEQREIPFSTVKAHLHSPLIDKYHLQELAAANPNFDALEWVIRQVEARKLE